MIRCLQGTSSALFPTTLRSLLAGSGGRHARFGRPPIFFGGEESGLKLFPGGLAADVFLKKIFFCIFPENGSIEISEKTAIKRGASEFLSTDRRGGTWG
jgi:hypothetical protein